MVIRRIRNHVATHNWFAVGIDLLIVVVGVFLGTQATNWNAARIAAQDAHTYREQLIEDIDANQIDFRFRRAYYTDVRRHALAALEALHSPSQQLGEPFIIDAYQASQINARTLRRSTYDMLLQAGALTSIGDEHLRDIAETYYQGLKVLDDSNEHLPPYRERVRRELPYEVVTAIRERCGDQTSEFHGVVIFQLPSQCHLGLDQRAIQRAVAQLRTAAGLERDLSRYILEIDQRLGNFGGSERRGQQFRAALERANGARPSGGPRHNLTD
jgi:hypothetical protein